MIRALGEYEIGGLTTLIPFHAAILDTEQWAKRRDLPRPARGPQVAEVDGARSTAPVLRPPGTPGSGAEDVPAAI